MARYLIADQLGSFVVGDTPVLTVELVDESGTPVSLDGATGVTALLDGDAVTASISGDEIVVTIESALTEGVRWLSLTVASETEQVGADPAPLVVEAPNGWHSLASARAEWRDAPELDVQLYAVLEVAREQCVEYGPVRADGESIPFTWRQAQIMQARNVWNSAKTDPATSGLGGEDFVIRPFPMDQTIRLILRPKRAIGAIG